MDHFGREAGVHGADEVVAVRQLHRNRSRLQNFVRLGNTTASLRAGVVITYERQTIAVTNEFKSENSTFRERKEEEGSPKNPNNKKPVLRDTNSQNAYFIEGRHERFGDLRRVDALL